MMNAKAGISLLFSLALLAGCAGKNRMASSPNAAAPSGPSVVMEPEPAIPTDWRAVATPADVERLGRLDLAWTAALNEARPRFGKEIAAEGALLDPKGAEPRAMPPPGRYECRVVRLGTASARRRGPAFIAFPSYYCYVEIDGELTTFVKESGTHRPAGRLWPDDDKRLVFLGAAAEGNEGQAPAYREKAMRDMVGVVERVGAFRWRMVLPWPHTGASLDVIEMVPFIG